ncbi:Hypothetical protein NTJ_06101 [Nesidiocoris tenuis]|uniref:Uncharacterized protein n=1 Tax=Nesidiocoris tenuis TaxID=355587 RepID=A0ABN7ASD1_9HEMI|nr:Hypothetical protein NTJ_06101 [Nesidiocoris tenuis]
MQSRLPPGCMLLSCGLLDLEAFSLAWVGLRALRGPQTQKTPPRMVFLSAVKGRQRPQDGCPVAPEPVLEKAAGVGSPGGRSREGEHGQDEKVSSCV